MWLTGVAFVLVVLSRLDAVSIVGLFGLAVLVRMVQKRRRARDIWRTAVALAAPTAIVAVAYMAVNQFLFEPDPRRRVAVKALPGPTGGWPDMQAYFKDGLGVPGPIGPGLVSTVVVVLVVLSFWMTRRLTEPTLERRRMVELSWIVGLTYCSGLLLVADHDRTSSWKLLSWYYYAATVVLLLGPGVVVANVFEWWHAVEAKPTTSNPQPQRRVDWRSGSERRPRSVLFARAGRLRHPGGCSRRRRLLRPVGRDRPAVEPDAALLGGARHG